MNERFTAFSISSTHMKMTIGFFRVSTPTVPIVNMIALRIRKCGSRLRVMGSYRLRLALREDHDADDAHEQQDGGELEGVDVAREEVPPDHLDLGDLVEGDVVRRHGVGELRVAEDAV